MMCAESYFINISLVHQNLMIALQKVQFQKASHATKLAEKIINSWDWKTIFNHNRIQRAIINTKSPSTIVLSN